MCNAECQGRKLVLGVAQYGIDPRYTAAPIGCSTYCEIKDEALMDDLHVHVGDW